MLYSEEIKRIYCYWGHLKLLMFIYLQVSSGELSSLSFSYNCLLLQRKILVFQMEE